MCEFSDKVDAAKKVVPAVSPQEANAQKTGNPDVVFLDPRDADSIRSTTGIIPGALNVTLGELEAANDDLFEKLGSRERTIITACQGGPMGAIAAHVLQKCGYRNVRFMDGGTQGWLDAGYATVR